MTEKEPGLITHTYFVFDIAAGRTKEKSRGYIQSHGKFLKANHLRIDQKID